MDLRQEIVNQIKEMAKTMTMEEIRKSVIDLELKTALACSQGEEVKAP